jgi:hypothetical protein
LCKIFRLRAKECEIYFSAFHSATVKLLEISLTWGEILPYNNNFKIKLVSCHIMPILNNIRRKHFISRNPDNAQHPWKNYKNIIDIRIKPKGRYGYETHLVLGIA